MYITYLQTPFRLGSFNLINDFKRVLREDGPRVDSMIQAFYNLDCITGGSHARVILVCV